MIYLSEVRTAVANVFPRGVSKRSRQGWVEAVSVDGK